MHTLAALQPVANPISPDTLLSHAGLVVLALIIFAECGLLIGFFLPGDTLLFAAGIALATGSPKLPALGYFLVITPIAAIAGNCLGYWIGRRLGPGVFNRPQSRLFKPSYVERSQAYFDRFGPATVLVARFVPVVRTVATVMAGVSRMRFGLYLVTSIIGGIVWTDGVLLLGHQLGKIKFVQENKGYVDYAVLAVVIIGLIPAAIHLISARRRPRADVTD
jgi:membrane-associated protein